MNPLRTTHGPARGFCFSDTGEIKTNPEAFCKSFGDIFYEKSVHSGFSNFPEDVLHDLLGSRNSAFTDVIYGVFGVFAGFRDVFWSQCIHGINSIRIFCQIRFSCY